VALERPPIDGTPSRLSIQAAAREPLPCPIRHIAAARMQATGGAVVQMTEGIAGSLRVVWKFGKAEVPRIGGILSAVYRGSKIRLIPGPGDFVRVQLIANAGFCQGMSYVNSAIQLS
jgi:hypothetical protein